MFYCVDEEEPYPLPLWQIFEVIMFSYVVSLVEKKSMGGEMSFRLLVRPHHSFTSLFSHPGDKF
jgi:hypothetical protein